MKSMTQLLKKMTRPAGLGVVIMVVCLGLALTTSCAKKKIKAVPADRQVEISDAEKKAAAEAEKQRQRQLEEERLLEEQRLKDEQEKEMARQAALEAARGAFTGEDIYFEFDSSALLAEAQELLTQKAQWLRNNASVEVIIEGHTDSRGTGEYNLALGDRRAESTKNFLIDLGIEPSRLTTVSYGEERPVDPGENEAAWALNRRAHFVVR